MSFPAALHQMAQIYAGMTFCFITLHTKTLCAEYHNKFFYFAEAEINSRPNFYPIIISQIRSASSVGFSTGRPSISLA